MIKNYTGFFGWQGNEATFESWMKYVLIALMIIIMLAIWIFREKIALRFDRQGKILWFKSQDHMWRWAGAIGLFFSTFRLILMWVFGYPLYWEGLALHLCRLHIWIIFFFMIFGKTKWIKYITYISVVGAIFGIMFANMQSEMMSSTGYVNGSDANGPVLVPSSGQLGGYTNYDDLHSLTHADGKTPWTQLEKLSYLSGLTQYNAGFDNYFIYDFTLAHESLVFFPLFIRAAYRQTYSNKEFFRTQIVYVVATTLMWTLNVAMGSTSVPNWRANYWFIGLDGNNDEYNALGVLSAWPQNLFSYLFLGILFTFAFHTLWFATAKVEFFRKDKWYKLQIVKSAPAKAFKDGFYKGWFKDIFILKRNKNKN